MHLSWAMSFATKKYYYKKPGMIENAKAKAQWKADTRAEFLEAKAKEGKRVKANKGTKRPEYHP